MTPAASVSGFYFSHPESRYFNVGRIGQDQLQDLAQRRGMDGLNCSACWRESVALWPPANSHRRQARFVRICHCIYKQAKSAPLVSAKLDSKLNLALFHARGEKAHEHVFFWPTRSSLLRRPHHRPSSGCGAR